MRRNRVDAILVEQAKKKRIITCLCICIVFVSIVIFYFIALMLTSNKEELVKYQENSNIDYKIYLKDNEFFENNYLEANNQYIADIVENIKSKFKYDIEIDKSNFDYSCNYKVQADIDVREKTTNNSLYNYSEILLDNISKESKGKKKINIDEEILVDYNKYNDVIKKFISTYSLDNVVGTLSINMFVNIKGQYDEDVKTSIISLNIPLATKTLDIDTMSNLVNSKDNSMIYRENKSILKVQILIVVLLVIADIILIIRLRQAIENLKTDETVYESALKKILNNYHSYIQKINNEIDISEYKVLNVDTFREMIEIKETIEKPILMVENEEKTETKFIMITDNNLVYVYELRLSNIKKQKKHLAGIWR